MIHAHRDLTGERRTRDTGSRAVDDADHRQADWASFRRYQEDDIDDDRFISIEELEDELGFPD